MVVAIKWRRASRRLFFRLLPIRKGWLMRVFFLGLIMAGAMLANAGIAMAAGDSEKSTGLMGKNPDLALWSVVVFVLFVLLLRKTAWGPLAKGLDQRESKIREDMASAQADREKSERLVREHEAKVEAAQEEIREMMVKAREDSERLKSDILAEARSESETLRERAVEEIDRARDQALKELFDTVTGQVVGATEHILGRSLAEADQDRLISEALADFAGQSHG